ncbi:MAG: sialate O-acetylesterase [Planctomycetes bacterium]|nr:sialate O-acetylesterase [Planctomycetota bacterium]
MTSTVARVSGRSTLRFALVAACLAPAAAPADVSLNNMFGDHMVLQQGIRNKVWGKADPGENVTVTLGDGSKAAQTHTTTAGADGSWHVLLDAVKDYGGPHTLTVKGKNTVTFNDVLIGEVWVCAGQSNMQWSVNASNDPDLEKAAANFPMIRLISVPQVGTQDPQWNFNGSWQACTPESVGNFSAVGYFFGRQLHQTLGVPVGLINNAWGGSAAEAWVKRDKLAGDGRYKGLMERWEKLEADYPAAKAEFEKKFAEWKEAAEKAKAEGKPAPQQPGNPDGQMRGNARPGNIHSGVLTPSIGYGIKGAIWYQGESNAGRAYQYRELFPFMIKSWRDEWALGDFPFYWVQLADFKAEQAAPAESDWAELREAQTMTMKALPATGEAVIIDIGEGKDIHPKNKQDVAKRLARWALAETYKKEGIVARSPLYKGMEKQASAIVLSFDHVAGGWRPFDVAEPRGFTIAGADKKFVAAKAKILPDGRIEVSADGVTDPVAVRYAWADNPVCNMFSGAGLPLTPFRTDDFPGVTVDKQ